MKLILRPFLAASMAVLSAFLIPDLSFAQSASPTLIPFQGRLTDQAGVAYTNGQYTLTFNLYDQAVGGSTVWTERHEKVGVINGTVNVFLGSIQTIENVAFDTTKYLGITVDADDNPATADPEMVPRTMIIPAFYAKNAGSLAGHNWTQILTGGSNNPQTGFINGGKIGGGTVTNVQIQDGGVTTADLGNGQVTAAKLAAGAADSAISDGAITSAKILNGGVATVDLADGAVTSAKIADGAIVGMDIGTESIEPAKLIHDIAIYSQVEGAGVGGGYPSTTPWQIRTLNRTEAETLPAGSAISRTGNRISLQPGVYKISAFASAFRATIHQIALRDVTGAPSIPPVVIRGDTVYNHYSNPSYSESSTRSELAGVITVAGGVREFQLYHYLAGVSLSWGGTFTMGYPVGGADPSANENVYVRIIVERIK